LSVGIFSALRPRSLIDRFAMVFVLIGVSAHPVWIGLIFSYFFGVKWHLTPIANYANFFGAPADSGLPGGPWQWFYHMILPWCTFALLFAALYVRMIRANVMETMNEDYVRTARAKGAPERQVLVQHVLRNALLPVVTMLGMDIGVAKAVDGVSFSIEKGETLGIVGESGSGKSVTCLTIMGLNPPRNTVSSGEAVLKGDLDLLGAKPRELREIRGDDISMIFQD